MRTNPSWNNFDPRVGVAYDPFSDHKTSIRAGFGMFHEVLDAGVWGIGLINSDPWNILTQALPPVRILYRSKILILPEAQLP